MAGRVATLLLLLASKAHAQHTDTPVDSTTNRVLPATSPPTHAERRALQDIKALSDLARDRLQPLRPRWRHLPGPLIGPAVLHRAPGLENHPVDPSEALERGAENLLETLSPCWGAVRATDVAKLHPCWGCYSLSPVPSQP